MQTLRRFATWNAWDAFSRLSFRQVLALFLVVIIPGGLVVPLCCGIYGALRHSLAGKSAADSADPAMVAAVPEASQR